MKSFLKDFNDNFWKYMVVIVLIIMLSFSIKWTNCLCSFSEAAVRFFDRNVPNEHFTVEHGLFGDAIKKAQASVGKATNDVKNDVKIEAEEVTKNANADVEKATAKANSTIAIAKKEEQEATEKAEKEKDIATAQAKLEIAKKTPYTTFNSLKNQAKSLQEEAGDKAKSLQEEAENKANSIKNKTELSISNKIEDEKKQLANDVALLESFTSKVRTCEIKSPNNIVAGYMNSIDHDINNACNHSNQNDCSLVKSSVTGGVQYIESRSLRKSHGEFSGVSEWTKQTQ